MRTSLLPPGEWWRIRSRHHASELLLPIAGDPVLDRFYVAAAARIALNEDRIRRNAALQRQLREARKKGLAVRLPAGVPLR